MVQIVQKRLVVPQVQFMDSDVVVPVVRRLVPGLDVQNTAEMPQLHFANPWEARGDSTGAVLGWLSCPSW